MSLISATVPSIGAGPLPSGEVTSRRSAVNRSSTSVFSSASPRATDAACASPRIGASTFSFASVVSRFSAWSITEAFGFADGVSVVWRTISRSSGLSGESGAVSTLDICTAFDRLSVGSMRRSSMKLLQRVVYSPR